MLTARWDACAAALLRERVEAHVAAGRPFEAALMLALGELLAR